MSSILDQVVQVGVESTYGTAVAPTRAYEARADTFARDVASSAQTSTGTPCGNSTTWPLEKCRTTPSDPPEYVTVVLGVLVGLN